MRRRLYYAPEIMNDITLVTLTTDFQIHNLDIKFVIINDIETMN